MMEPKIEYGIETLLELDGTTMVVDPAGHYWVKFVVCRVPCAPERPHGLNYSLTLHAADGERLVGFDNAHAVTLLADFWNEVDRVLKQRGIIP